MAKFSVGIEDVGDKDERVPEPEPEPHRTSNLTPEINFSDLVYQLQ